MTTETLEEVALPIAIKYGYDYGPEALDHALTFVREVVAALGVSVPAKDGRIEESAKEKFDLLFDADYDQSPIERLRAFCSFAMNGQDWIDVEPFFDALSPTTVPEGWQLVPIEPTKDMLKAALCVELDAFGVNSYKAMLSAAPKP
jgi:hypothetical protein